MTWGTVPLGEVVDVLSGFAFDSKSFGDSGEMPIVRIRDVVKGLSKTYFTGSFDGRYIVEDGDLLVGMDGEFNRGTWRGGPALLNQRVCKISARGVDPRYLYHVLPPALAKIEEATPFVTVKHLSVKVLREAPIPLPPLPEQRRISAILDEVDALRAQGDRALSTASTVAGELFRSIEPAYANPVRLGDLGAWASGGTPRRTNSEFFGGSIPWVTSGELGGLYIDGATEKITSDALASSSAKLVPPGALMLGMYDTAALKSSIATADVACNQAVAFGILGSAAIPEYVYFAVQSRKPELRLLQRGIRQKNLNLSIIRDIEIKLPSRDVQESFAEQLAALTAVQLGFEARLVEFDTLFASLQHRAFRGEL